MSTAHSTASPNDRSAHSCALSRNGAFPSRMGKATFPLKAMAPDELGERFQSLASSLGMSTSELLGELAAIRVFGLAEVQRMRQEQLERVAGIGQEQDL